MGADNQKIQKKEITMEESKTTVESLFSKLFKIDVSDYTETKKSGNTELTYLSWAWAWATFKKECPLADYEIVHWDGKPYMYDENLGYMVETKVTDGYEWKTMWLPVMNGANKAMKAKPYTYTVKKYGGGTEEKTVEAATMFDINTAIMRCLVKNIGMFGLGLYIYAGEDLPEGETVKKGSKATYEKPSIEKVIAGMEQMTTETTKKFYAKAIELYGKETPEYKQWIKVWADKKEALEKAAVKEDLKSELDALDQYYS